MGMDWKYSHALQIRILEAAMEFGEWNFHVCFWSFSQSRVTLNCFSPDILSATITHANDIRYPIRTIPPHQIYADTTGKRSSFPN